MKDHVRRGALAVAAACALLALSPASAQQMPDSTTFLKAVKEADGAKANQLLSAPGSSVAKSRDPGSGETALHIAVRRRDLPWTNFMLGAGVDPNLADKAGDTPLGLATRLGFAEGARRLIARGAQIDGSGTRGETPLIIAVLTRRLDMVRLLMLNGANPDLADASAGYSARDYARRDRRSAAILKALDERPAKATTAKATGPSR